MNSQFLSTNEVIVLYFEMTFMIIRAITDFFLIGPYNGVTFMFTIFYTGPTKMLKLGSLLTLNAA